MDEACVAVPPLAVLDIVVFVLIPYTKVNCATGTGLETCNSPKAVVGSETAVLNAPNGVIAAFK
jgi:hypothetical protein